MGGAGFVRRAQLCHKRLQRWRQRCGKPQHLAAGRVRQGKLRGVQEHALQALFFQRLVERKIAIFLVTQQRKTLAGQMYANLVRASGFQFHFQQRIVRPALQAAHDAVRGFALIAHPHAPFAIGQQVFFQRQPDVFARVRKAPFHQRKIAFFHAPFAQHVVQGAQGAALARDDEQTGGFTVQPVRQFQKTLVRTLAAQLFDDAKGHAAAAVHGQTGRFVEHQQRGVFMHQRQRRTGRHKGLRRAGRAQRRNAHLVARLHARARLRAATVQTYLTAADDAVHMAFGHAFEVAQQPVIQPHSFQRLVNHQDADSGGNIRVFALAGIHEYTSRPSGRFRSEPRLPEGGERGESQPILRAPAQTTITKPCGFASPRPKGAMVTQGGADAPHRSQCFQIHLTFVQRIFDARIFRAGRKFLRYAAPAPTGADSMAASRKPANRFSFTCIPNLPHLESVPHC